MQLEGGHICRHVLDFLACKGFVMLSGTIIATVEQLRNALSS